MPRLLGIFLIAAAAALLGVYGWFGLIWLLSAAAKLTYAHALNVTMFLLAPHIAGWLVALALAVAAFVLGLGLARKRRISWLGFADEPIDGTAAGAQSPPPAAPGR
jgi:hypothetical protein